MSIVESCTNILPTYSLMEHIDVVMMLNKKTIYDICRYSLEKERPTYTNLNKVIFLVVSSMTTSFLFDGAIKMDTMEL